MALSNPERGCGTLKKGGCYAQGSMGAGGILNPWTWVLGRQDLGQIGFKGSIVASVPARQPVLIDPSLTLLHEQLIPFDIGGVIRKDNGVGTALYFASQLNVGSVAVADHIGSSFYTPWSFATEVMQHGPSRRITPLMAKIMVNLPTPFRIFFTHSDVPWFLSSAYRADWIAENNVSVHDGAWFDATWNHSRWGGMISDWDGSDHFMVDVLRFTDESKVDIPHPHETFIGYSWITDIVYVLKDDEHKLPAELQPGPSDRRSITAARIEEDHGG